MSYVVNNPNFWNNKYINNQDKWDIGKPTPFFVDWEKKLQNKQKILIPGCGKGHDVIYMASKNHNVTAVDFSKYSIEFLNKKAKEKNLKIKTFLTDFFSLHKEHDGKYDVVLEYTFFCAISPNKRKDYFKKCYSLLNNSGSIIGIFLPLSTNETGPPFKVSVENIKKVSENYFDISIVNKNINSINKRLNNEVFIKLDKKCLNI